MKIDALFAVYFLQLAGFCLNSCSTLSLILSQYTTKPKFFDTGQSNGEPNKKFMANSDQNSVNFSEGQVN